MNEMMMMMMKFWGIRSTESWPLVCLLICIVLLHFSKTLYAVIISISQYFNYGNCTVGKWLIAVTLCETIDRSIVIIIIIHGVLKHCTSVTLLLCVEYVSRRCVTCGL